jgi:hypothetical protein
VLGKAWHPLFRAHVRVWGDRGGAWSAGAPLCFELPMPLVDPSILPVRCNQVANILASLARYCKLSTAWLGQVPACTLPFVNADCNFLIPS